MKLINKIGHWLLFLIGSYIGTWIVLAITTMFPFYILILLIDLGDFWFYLLGSIIIGIYYLIVFGCLSIYFYFLNQKKPDYWISNIFLVLTALFFFYTLINRLGNNFNDAKEFYTSFKGILFLISILPAFLKILFFSILSPFIKDK